MDQSGSSEALRALQHENADLRAENRALTEEVSRLRHAVRALKDLQDSLNSITPESDALALVNKILALALVTVDSENGSLLLLDEESGELVFVTVQGPNQAILTGYRLPAGEGIAGWVVANRQPELVRDVRYDPRFSAVIDQATGHQTTSLLCVPLIYGDRTLGAIEIINSRGDAEFSPEDLDVLLLFSRLAVEAIITAEKAA